MTKPTLFAVAALLGLGSCRTQLADYSSNEIFDGGPPDEAMPRHPDLAVPIDAAMCALVDDASQNGGCPCGAAGLCRPATGRLSVQIRSHAGQLKLVVMDDNGCNRVDVALDEPIGVPRWAPDYERLAYITGNQSTALHVVRVAPSGQVVCRAGFALGGIQAMEVAWANDQQLWLGTEKGPIRWDLANGIADEVPIKMARFDADGEGPLVIVDDKCGVGCASTLSWRPDVAMGALMQLVMTPMNPIGPVRLSSDGSAVVYELSGFNIQSLQGGTPQALGQSGDRSPAFALHDQAIVYATDDGELKFHSLVGPPQDDLAIPSTWDAVYSPDWTPQSPPTCQPNTACF